MSNQNNKLNTLKYYSLFSTHSLHTLPSVCDGQLPSVSETAARASHRHTSEGGTTQVEVSPAIGAIPTWTLVGHYDGNGPSGAYGSIQAPNFVARTTPFPVLE